MALADLVARLERDAQARVDDIGARADAEVRDIEAAAARGVADAAKQRLGRLRAERLSTLARELAQARLRARAAELAAQRALVERIMARARESLAEVEASPRYVEAVPILLDEALAYVEGLEARVRCSPSTALVLRSSASRRDLRIEIDPSAGPGVTVEAVDGALAVAIDNSLAARLGRLEPQLTIDLLARVDDGHR